MNVKSPRGQVHGVEGHQGQFVMTFCGSGGDTVVEQRIRSWDPSSKWVATKESVNCKNCIRVMETDAKASTL